jgi:hypothetical protein
VSCELEFPWCPAGCASFNYDIRPGTPEFQPEIDKNVAWTKGISAQLDEHNLMVMGGQTIRLKCPTCGLEFHCDIELQPMFSCHRLTGNTIVDDRREARF